MPDAEPESAESSSLAQESEPLSLDDELLLARAQNSEERLCLRSLLAFAQIRSHEGDPSPRVQYADDMMHIAVREAVVRIAERIRSRHEEPKESR